jgi:hypothetical protein
MPDELKPCPFCNGKQIKTNEIQHNRGCFMVLQAMPRPDTVAATLREAWNVRAETALRAQLAESKRDAEIAKSERNKEHVHTHRAQVQLAEAVALLRLARPYLNTGNAFKQDDDEPAICKRIDAVLGKVRA